MDASAAALVSGAVPAAMMAAVLKLLAAGADGDYGDCRLTVGWSAGGWSFERRTSERVSLGVAGYGLRVIKSDWRGDGGGEEVVARKGGGG